MKGAIGHADAAGDEFRAAVWSTLSQRLAENRQLPGIDWFCFKVVYAGDSAHG
jgi:hypothetical protein